MKMNQFILFILLISCFIFSSCSPFASYVGVKPDPPSIHKFIEPGDKVKIITKDDAKLSFVVIDVTDDSILGEKDTVLFTNISKLQKETTSAAANIWWGNNETVGNFWWLDGWCDSFEYSPEQKEWVCSE